MGPAEPDPVVGGDGPARWWTWRDLDLAPDEAWDRLARTAWWPRWGPTVTAVEPADVVVSPGLRGRVRTPLGVRVPFVVDEVVPGERWSWSVWGRPATDHAVVPLGTDRSRVGIGVPRLAAPYLLVCRLALRRLERLRSD
jgi:hypothetical protein